MTQAKKVLLIAEAGVNHNGSMDMAKNLVKAGAEAGADIVKFQTFKAALLATPHANQADYQRQNTGSEESQLAMLQRLELDRASHDALLAECRKQGVQFLSTAFDDESIDLLKEYPMPFWKIPSGELTNLPYLRRIGAMGGKIVLSTGMATLSDIEAALTALIKAGTRQDDMTILHCSTEYPTPWGDVNLKAMETIRDAFKIAVGYSDHTRGIEVPIAAVALGATIIEKHFTMNRDLPGPDHAASLEPGEFRMMANAIRNIEIALGSGIKKPSETELQNRLFARKSLVAKRTITKGETIMPDAITAKRPGSGLSPMLIDLLVGTIARRDFNPDELMEL